MRVIFLTHNYPRSPGDLPGGFLHPLALALRADGVDVRVVAPADGGRGGQADLDGVPVRRVRYAPAALETLAYTGRLAGAIRTPQGLRALFGLWRALRGGARAEAAASREPVVVHAHWWFPAGMAAPPEFPMVLTLHGSDARLLEHGTLAPWLGRRVLRRAAVVSAVSMDMAQRVTRATGREIPPEQVQAMPMDTTRFRRSTGGGGLVAVTRLTAQKRLHLLIEAVARLDHAPPVAILGDGPARQQLEELVARLGLTERVHFAGTASPAQVAERLATADLFILPAEQEGYGLSAAEAVMSGVPILVCTDGGGLLDLISRPGAGRAVPADPHAIAAAIGALLADPGAREAAWKAGQQIRTHLDPATAAHRAHGWYRKAMVPR
ncbi:MAG TPA: glycosyltransferase [Gemmatimonadales bacterium]|nr:glycosyltransferase [Gemmatimonadales bacterium]